MRTGDHRHRITFYADAVIKQANGDVTGERVPVLEMWAKVKALTGQRALNAGQILNGKPYEIEVRNPYPLELTEDMLIGYGGLTIAIKSVVDLDERREVLLITGTAKR